MSEWSEIVGAVIDYVHYQRECGVISLETTPAILAALRGTAAKRVVNPHGRTADSAKTASRGSSLTTVDTAPPPALPTLPPDADAAARTDALQEIAALAAACTRCPLHQERQQVVPGQGQADRPDILFVGEAPGQEEDNQGLAFVGRSGQLVGRMIEAMGYSRERVFIANVCKCRPPGNRTPSGVEMAACLPFLNAQIEILKPRTIVALGNVAVAGLLPGKSGGITRLRGRWLDYHGIPVMPTFHPAYLLRFPPARHDTWADMMLVLDKLGHPRPSQQAPPGAS